MLALVGGDQKTELKERTYWTLTFHLIVDSVVSDFADMECERINETFP